MPTCQSCGATLPERAYFCGSCGRTVNYDGLSPTGISSPGILPPANTDARTIIGVSQPLYSASPTNAPPDAEQTLVSDWPTSEQEGEEEKRRRALLLGLALPLAGDAILEGPLPGGAPSLPGTPSFGGAPAIAGTPQFGVDTPTIPLPNHPPSSYPGGPGTPGLASPAPPFVLPQTYPTQPTPSPGSYQPPKSYPPTTPSPGSHQPPKQGCLIWMVVIIVLPLLILASIFGAGFTIFAPTLALTGTAAVTPGGQLQIHGTNFIPGSTVTLTLDASIPLYFSYQSTPAEALSRPNSQSLLLLANHLQLPASGSSITTPGNGTFHVMVTVGQNWRLGQHTIRASEGLSPRSATLTFTIVVPTLSPSDSVTATTVPSATTSPTATSTPASSPTSTPIIMPSATTVTSGLTTIAPASVSLGPVSEGYNQAISTQVTLNTQGTNLIVWTASWNQNQAPWLRLNLTSGQIQAPGTQQITLDTLATNLKAGNYTTTVTFASAQSKQSIALGVSFAVQAGCLGVTPGQISFTGVAGISDPASQTIVLNNCGKAASWSISTAGTPNWLSANPTSGNFNGGASQNVTITASDLNARLAAGTYQGKIVFTDGSSQMSLVVTLTVQPAPVLSVSSPSIINTSCQFSRTTPSSYWLCFESLSSSQGAQANLDWTTSSTGVQGIIFKPTQGTLSPGQTVRVEIDVPVNNCATTTSLIFTGPGNTVTVPWSCSSPLR